MNDEYGTVDWFDREYGKVSLDPWGLAWRRSQQLRYRRMLSTLSIIEAPVRRVLDIGCATGDFTYLLSKHIPDVDILLGVDFVESAVERARVRFPSVTFAQQSVFSIGQEYEQQFDLVACLEVLYYVQREQQRPAIQSIKQAIRPGGHAIFSSLISPPPHFSTNDFLELVASEFDIVYVDILHLRLINVIEKIASRFDRQFGKRNTEGSPSTFCQLPFRTVVSLERWCKRVKLFSSHTLVLGRTR